MLKLLSTLLLGAALATTVGAATTDGTATFQSTLSHYSSAGSGHWTVGWVTAQSGTFIKNLRKQGPSWSNSDWKNHCGQWNTARASSTNLDGYSSATATTYSGTNSPVYWSWNCRDTNNTLVADGTYVFWLQYAEDSGQGPYTTNGMVWVKGPAGVTNSYSDLGPMTARKVSWVPAVVPHELAVLSLTPSIVASNTVASMQVLVTNKSATTESFTVALTNLTTGALIASQAVGSLPGNTATNVALAWNTAGLFGNYSLKAVAGPLAGETNPGDNALTNVVSVTVRVFQHDLGLFSLSAPALVLPNKTNTVTVVATNGGDFAETFSVNLYDDTQQRLIGSNRVSNLSIGTVSNLSFAWRSTNSLYGSHSLRAVALAVAGETNLLDNTNSTSVALADGWSTNAFIAKASLWQFNDQGLDLTLSPWLATNYYDAAWSQGAGPLGYSQNNSLTNLTTRLSWGATSTNKNPACYFRQSFTVDSLPTALTINVRRIDGVALYLNGVELARFNMPQGPLAYTNLASVGVEGAARYTYFSTNVAAGALQVGANVLAAEVHRANRTGSDLAFDLELLGVVPQVPVTHDVDALAMTAANDAMVGDQLPVSVTLTNRGTVTETVLVLLRNNTTGQIVGSQTLSGLAPGGSTTVQFDWNTLGALNGVNNLAAYTVIGGVTNWAGAFTNAAFITASSLRSNPVNALASLGGRCGAMASAGTQLLLGAGATLEVWDRSAANAPVKVGAVRLPGLIEAIATSGSYAYVACGSAGVQVVDLTAPSMPQYRSTLKTSGHAYSLAVSGLYLYLAEGSAGLRILSIASPQAPQLIGSYYTAGPACAVAMSGANLCLLDQYQGLLVLNVANPAAPALVGACTNFDAGQALAIGGSAAYVVDGNNHLFVINLANPAAPTLAGTLLLPGIVGQAVAVNGTTVYVAAGADGLLTINASTPSAPTLTATTATPGLASALATGGSKLYVADSLAGLQILDLTAPGAPAAPGEFPTGLRANDVLLANGLAYVAAGEGGLQIFSLTNPFAPARLSHWSGVTNARALALALSGPSLGSIAYVGDGQYGLKIVNVADPLAPTLLGAYADTNLGSIRNVGASGSLVVVSDGRTLQLLNASAPATPTLAGSYSAPTFVYSMAVSDAKAYLACGNAGLIILNVSSGAFTPLGSYSSGELVSGVAVSGTKAYISSPASGWRILDVSNPAAPALLKNALAQGPAWDVAASGTNVLLTTASNTLASMNVSAPLTPVQAGSFGPLVGALRLAASPELAAAAEGEAGLALFATTDDINHDGLPDWWQMQIVAASLATNGPIRSINEVLPNDDFDGDGASNYAEYLAGTSPVDASSRFLMAAPQVVNGSRVDLRWTSVAGKTYSIFKSTNLLSGFTLYKSDIAATPPLNSDSDSLTNGAGFYIIGVK